MTPVPLAAAISTALGGAEQASPSTLSRTAGLAARRRSLWQLPSKHHCVLLGSAFDAPRLRAIFRRSGYADWQSATDYELHSSAVCFARQRNDFSVSAQRLLEQAYRAAVNRFAACRSAREILDLWRFMAARGDAVGAYWAALTHPASGAELDQILADEMHLVAHQEFAARRATLRQKHALEERCAGLEAKLADGHTVAERLRSANAELSSALHEARAALSHATRELARWRAGEVALAAGARECELLDALEGARAEAAAKDRALREAIRRVGRASAATVRPPTARHTAPPDVQVQPKRHATRAVSGRQLLCVGGKTSLLVQYRAIVERAGGTFAHHDGGLENSVGRLPAMLAAADLVVCLTADCSHSAYRLAKRYCKAKGKACVLLGTSGVSAFSRVVRAPDESGSH